MQRKLDRFTTALSALLVVGALLACKKKAPPITTPSAEPVATALTPPAVTAPATPPANPAAPKLGDVKRYPDREKPQTGAVRILEDGVKVFNEADEKTSDVATLDKGLLVFRIASVPDWELVELPSGVGKVSPGWVQAKFIDAKADPKVEREAVASQSQQAAVKAPTTSTGAKPAASTAASAKPATSASAKPAAGATAKPGATTTAKPGATTTAKPAASAAPSPTTTTKKTTSKTAAPATSK